MDPRVLQTKNKLQDALTSLLQDLPLSDISVSLLCRTAHVDRNTFYAHYQNTQELLDEILNEHISKSIQFIENSLNQGDITLLLYDICDMMYHNKELSKLMTNYTLNQKYLLHIMKVCNEAIVSMLLQRQMIKTDIPINAVNRFACGGTLLILQDWCLTGMKERPEEIAGLLVNINNVYWSCFQA